MRQWLAAALLLVAATASAGDRTGKVGPPKSEFQDGTLFVSWRYVTPSGGMVYATPKLDSKAPPQFTAGEAFELSITVRISPNTENPCDLRIGSPSCDMEAKMYFTDAQGAETARDVWVQTGVLQHGLETFRLQGAVATDVQASRGHIDFRVRRGNVTVNTITSFPFRIIRR